VNVYVIGKHIGPIQSCNLFVFIFLIGSFFSVIHISLESIRACMPRGCCFTTVNSTFNTYIYLGIWKLHCNQKNPLVIGLTVQSDWKCKRLNRTKWNWWSYWKGWFIPF